MSLHSARSRRPPTAIFIWQLEGDRNGRRPTSRPRYSRFPDGSAEMLALWRQYRDDRALGIDVVAANLQASAPRAFRPQRKGMDFSRRRSALRRQRRVAVDRVSA